MKLSGVKPIAGFLVTKEEETRLRSDAGLQIEENTDDFLIYGEVVIGTDKFPVGSFVIYHVLESLSFRDGSQVFNLVREEDVFGTYTP